jgi:hypothetical protein
MIMERPGSTGTTDINLRPRADDGHDPVAGVSVPLLLVLRATSAAARAVSAPPTAINNWFTAAGHVAAQARATYLRLAARGAARLEEIRARPKAADALATVRHATDQTDATLQNLADEVEETTEEALGRLSIITRSTAQLAIHPLARWIPTKRNRNAGHGEATR